MVEGSFQKGDHGIRSLGIERMVLLVREPRVFSLLNTGFLSVVSRTGRGC